LPFDSQPEESSTATARTANQTHEGTDVSPQSSDIYLVQRLHSHAEGVQTKATHTQPWRSEPGTTSFQGCPSSDAREAYGLMKSVSVASSERSSTAWPPLSSHVGDAKRFIDLLRLRHALSSLLALALA
jgi:hypothetical protein